MTQLTAAASRVTGFLAHWFRAGNEHSVHSPFVFRLLTEAVYSKSSPAEALQIERIRKAMLTSHAVIDTIDYGAGSTYDGRAERRKVSDIAARFAKSAGYCRLLYRLVKFFEPAVMIELGTSLGISALYQAAGNPRGMLHTLEGDPQTADLAKKNFETYGAANIHSVTGRFDDTLPALLHQLGKFDWLFVDGNHTYEATTRYFQMALPHVHEKSVLLFDDINWSAGMKKAWNGICEHPSVTISIDFFQFGLVFFDTGFSRQHFLLKL